MLIITRNSAVFVPHPVPDLCLTPFLPQLAFVCVHVSMVGYGVHMHMYVCVEAGGQCWVFSLIIVHLIIISLLEQHFSLNVELTNLAGQAG